MKKNILVVDDDFVAVRELKELLENHGYSVSVASSGDECLEKASEKAPSLILLDVILAGAGGISVCHRLKESPRTKEIPIIMVTGLIGDSIQETGHRSGAEYVINKPYDPADLLWAVEDVMQKKGGS